MTTLRIWRRAYRPFICGGNVNAPVYLDVELTDANGPHDLGHGFKGYVLPVPGKDKTVVVEARSGGIVGEALDRVREDTMSTSKAVCEHAVLAGIARRDEAEPASAEEFWCVFTR